LGIRFHCESFPKHQYLSPKPKQTIP
jgi:hypothetical protein